MPDSSYQHIMLFLFPYIHLKLYLIYQWLQSQFFCFPFYHPTYFFQAGLKAVPTFIAVVKDTRDWFRQCVLSPSPARARKCGLRSYYLWNIWKATRGETRVQIKFRWASSGADSNDNGAVQALVCLQTGDSMLKSMLFHSRRISLAVSQARTHRLHVLCVLVLKPHLWLQYRYKFSQHIWY